MSTWFSHVAYSCEDPIAVEQFYTRHLGFRRARVYAPGPGQVVVIRKGGLAIELFPAKGERTEPLAGGAGPETPGFRHLAFEVNDLEATLSELGADARITLGPLDMGQFIPGMRVAWIADPEGNIVELNQGYCDETCPPALEDDEAEAAIGSSSRRGC
jgi:glyoxylase I family protein